MQRNSEDILYCLSKIKMGFICMFFILPLVIDGGANQLKAESVLQQIETTKNKTCDPQLHDYHDILDLRVRTDYWENLTYLAFNISNILTKTFYIGDIENLTDSDLFRLTRDALFSGLPDVYGVGMGFLPNTTERHILFAPYTYMYNGLLIEVDYSDVVDHFTNKVFTSVQNAYGYYTNHVFSDIELSNGKTIKIPVAQPEDSSWTTPYFDCNSGDIWMISYSVPVYRPVINGSPRFVGIVILDFNLKEVDINQCDGNLHKDVFYNAFRGTHKCPKHSKVSCYGDLWTVFKMVRIDGCTHNLYKTCIFKSGVGLARGGYDCQCKDGSIINGLDVEDPNKGFSCPYF